MNLQGLRERRHVAKAAGSGALGQAAAPLLPQPAPGEAHQAAVLLVVGVGIGIVVAAAAAAAAAAIG